MIWVPFLGMATFDAILAFEARRSFQAKQNLEGVAWTICGLMVFVVVCWYYTGM